MHLFKTLFITIIALLTIAFACLNAQHISINYFVGTLSLPLSLLLAFTLIIGAFLGLIATFTFWLRQKTLTLRLEHRLKSTEKELANLRTLPLSEKE